MDGCNDMYLNNMKSIYYRHILMRDMKLVPFTTEFIELSCSNLYGRYRLQKMRVEIIIVLL